MTDPVNLDDVVVTGQRRSGAGDPFPTMPSYITIPAPYETPEVQKGDPIEVAPCEHAPFRQRWDADAAAVAAIQDFLDAAEDLSSTIRRSRATTSSALYTVTPAALEIPARADRTAEVIGPCSSIGSSR